MISFLIALSKIEINKIARHYAQLYILFMGSPQPYSGNTTDTV